MHIGRRIIGPGQPVFIVAEAGVNHNGDVALARRLIDVADEAGADAVKFQTFRAERLAASNAPKAEYQRQTTDADESQTEMLRRLELSNADHISLRDHCAARGILFLSTPFDEESADLLERLDVAAFKISSGDLTNLPFLRHVASKRRPMILSTGMATLGEVDDALQAVVGCPTAILQCVSNYPANAEDVNLRAMETLRAAFGKPVGYSDHTLGIEVALAAVALGATIVEKHFTLDNTMHGPDHRASLEPEELRRLVSGIRTVEAALGDGVKRPRPSELGVAEVARKALYWARALSAGSVVTAADIVALRPAHGLPPGRLSTLLGRPLRRAVEARAAVREGDFDD